MKANSIPVLVVAIVSSAAPFVWGQSRVPEPAGDEPLVLSAFEVTSQAERGYATTSSLSGSRVAVPVVELPASVITLNQKLIQDTVALSPEDTLGLVSGISISARTTTQNLFSMRGYLVASAQRDGFADRVISAAGGFDYSYIERIEVVKGPSGILYGSHSPGGIVNFVSKRPLARPRTMLSGIGGSYDTWRFELDHSGFIDHAGKLGYRLSTAVSDTAGPVRFKAEPDGGYQAYNPSISYRFDNGLQIWAWAAIVRDGSNRLTRTVHGFLDGPGRGRALIEEAELNGGNNIYNNLVEVKSDNYEVGAVKTLIFAHAEVDARAVARKYKLQSDASRIRGIGPGTDVFLDGEDRLIGQDSRNVPYSAVAGTLAAVARRQVRYDFRPSLTDGEDFAVDVNFRFKIGPTNHQLLFYGTYGTSEDESKDDAYDVTSNPILLSLGAIQANNLVYFVVRPSPTFVPDPQTILDVANVRTIRNTIKRDDEGTGIGVMERMSFLKDRIFLVGGARRSEIKTVTAQIVGNQSQNAEKSVDSAWTGSVAALAKVYQGESGTVSLFYNNNKTFTPVFTIDRRLATFGKRFPNRIASTDEVGLKLDLLKSRVVATGSWYDTEENNGLLTFNDESGEVTGIPISSYQAPVGTRTTRGWELDLNLNPMPGLEALVSYGKMESKLDDGRPASSMPFDTLSLLARYELPWRQVRGGSVSWIYQHWGESVLNTRTNWELPGGEIHTAVLGYARGRWNVRLRIENVLDKVTVLPSENETAIGVTRERNYRLSFTYIY
ncbi:MAG: TonB-dependent receptor plug domain-containing protein [Opitutaceae bacterium]|nr:TonB-dependent receptor plug domain-containing protein [Opitutaceae bacterium]